MQTFNKYLRIGLTIFLSIMVFSWIPANFQLQAQVAPTQTPFSSLSGNTVLPRSTLVSDDQVEPLPTAASGLTSNNSPNSVQLLSPANKSLIVSNDIQLSWREISTAKWYQLHITGMGNTKVFKQKFHNNTSICEAGICTINLPFLEADKKYKWWIVTKIDTVKVKSEVYRFNTFSKPNSLENLISVYHEDFESPVPSRLEVGSLWTIQNKGSGHVLQTASTSKVAYPGTIAGDIAIQVRFKIKGGAIRLSVHESELDNYHLDVKADGNFELYRNDTLLSTATIEVSQKWHSLRLSVIRSFVLVEFDEQTIFNIHEVSPLSSGSFSFSKLDSGTDNLVVDDFVLWLPTNKVASEDTVANPAPMTLLSSDSYAYQTRKWVTKPVTGNSPDHFTTRIGPNASSTYGRFVTFASYASNLVEGDVNGKSDVFIYDYQTGETQLASVSSEGAQGNQSSDEVPVISGNGQYVVFASFADNLVPDDQPYSSVGLSGKDIFIRNLQTEETITISTTVDELPSTNQELFPAISSNGRFVAFQSSSTNLVASDPNAAVDDVFVHDRDVDSNGIFDEEGNTQNFLISKDTTGAGANGQSGKPDISDDGRYVVFESSASDLVSNDTNGLRDVFVNDRTTGQTIRVGLNTSGGQFSNVTATGIVNPVISDDGQWVAYQVNSETDGGRIYVHHIQLSPNLAVGQITYVGIGYTPSINSDGSIVAFRSPHNLSGSDINGSADIYAYNTSNSTLKVISQTFNQALGNDDSTSPSISQDGKMVAFLSIATNLTNAELSNTNNLFIARKTASWGTGVAVVAADEQPPIVSINPAQCPVDADINIRGQTQYNQVCAALILDYHRTQVESTGADFTWGHFYSLVIDGEGHAVMLGDNSTGSLILGNPQTSGLGICWRWSPSANNNAGGWVSGASECEKESKGVQRHFPHAAGEWLFKECAKGLGYPSQPAQFYEKPGGEIYDGHCTEAGLLSYIVQLQALFSQASGYGLDPYLYVEVAEDELNRWGPTADPVNEIRKYGTCPCRWGNVDTETKARLGEAYNNGRSFSYFHFYNNGSNPFFKVE